MMSMLFFSLFALFFLFFVHPLWLSLLVFFSSIAVSLLKFFQLFELGLFSYLFIMVYSGGLLLLLVYMSSLVPNYNLTISSFSVIFFSVLILIYSMYSNEVFFEQESSSFSMWSFLGMSYFMNHKDLFYALIFLLLLSFIVISWLLAHLKYPLRSL